mmetsp:Transcript_60368/g.132125  ORF Transcript_60368/g.132125 Transcript_60368/m.132125 type:complete len:409 (+) Transcript_60368:265-1491(+)
MDPQVSPGPSAKRPRAEAFAEVVLRAKVSRCLGANEEVEFSVDRRLLTSEYFKAKLDRWHDEKTKPELTFELPEGSHRGGLQLVLDRLAAGETTTWSHFDWWWAVPDGNSAMLVTALFLMDLVLLQAYCKEVVSVFASFRIPLAEPYLSIGIKYDPRLTAPKPKVISPIASIDAEALQCVIREAIRSNDGMRELADRVIAGASDEALAQTLIPTIKEFYSVHQVGEIFGGVENQQTLPWMKHHLEQILRRRPLLAGDVLGLLRSDMKQAGSGVVGCKFWSPRLKAFASELVNLVFDTLFVESRRLHAEQRKELVLAIPNMIASAIALGDDLEPLWVHDFEWSHDTFGAAHVDVQLAILNSTNSFISQKSFLCGRAHTVRPEARRALLRRVDLLSDEDKNFLAKAAFPP